MELRVTVTRRDVPIVTRAAVLPSRSDDRWHEVRAPLGAVRGGDRVSIFAARGTFRDFHAWLVRDGPEASAAKAASR